MKKLWNLVTGWLKDPKLELRHAIVIGSLIITLGLTVGVALNPEKVWFALTALGTIGVVSWAIYRDEYVVRRRRPVLEISPYESDQPYLRKIPTSAGHAEMDPVTGEHEVTLAEANDFYLTLTLENTGKTIANSCQPFVTEAGSVENGEWKIQEGWVPVPLRWVFDPGAEKEERDLIPTRPYLFNLIILRSGDPDRFGLLCSNYSRNQQVFYGPGEHCFERTAFALGASPCKTYFRIKWNGGCSNNFEEVKNKIQIFQEGAPPW